MRQLPLITLFALCTIFTNVFAQVEPVYRWATGLGGSNGENGYSIAVDDSGNTYITGYFNATVDFDPGPGTVNLTAVGSADVFFAKYDEFGNYLWAKGIGGISEEFGRSIAVDGAGNVYITGYFWSTIDCDPGPGTANLTSIGVTDIFLAKYDPSGNYLWAHQIGGNSYDIGYGISVDDSGNTYITGSFQGTADFDPGIDTNNLTVVAGISTFFAKYDPNGNYVWANGFGSNSSSNEGYSIVTDSYNNVYLTGYFRNTVDFDTGPDTVNLTSNGLEDVFFAKYDSNGNYLWAKGLGGPGNDRGTGIDVDSSMNTCIAGYFSSTADFNPDSGTANLASVGMLDIFCGKYDTVGNYLWANGIGSVMDDAGYGVAADNSGNTYITGWFKDTADFDPGLDTVDLISAGQDDVFFAKYDQIGNYLWAKGLGGVDDEWGQGIAVDNDGYIYLSGGFNVTVDFDPGFGAANLTANAGWDIFFAKYGECNNSLLLVSHSTDSVSCYGNGDGSATITVTGGNTPYSFQWDDPDTQLTATATGLDTGTFTVIIIDSLGCNAITTVNIDGPPLIFTSTISTICSNDSVLLQGAYQSSSGTYYDTLTTINGCDSVVETTLSISPIYSISDSALTLCNGDSIVIYGTYQTLAGTYYDTLVTTTGCDSVRSTLVTFKPISLCVNPDDKITFQKTFGGIGDDVGISVKQCDDDGYIILAQGESFGSGANDYYLIRTNKVGDTLWTKVYGGGSEDIGLSVQQTTDGGFVSIGYTISFGMGNWDVYLIKTDSLGDTLWTKTYGVAMYPEYGTSVKETDDGGYIIGGAVWGDGVPYDEAYLIKIDSLGDMLWTKTYGGIDDDVCNSVQICDDGGYILVGYTKSFGAGNKDIYLIRTDSLGDTLWTRSYGGTNDEVGNDVKLCSDGGFIITGNTSSFGAGNLDAFLLKTNDSGNVEWIKTFGGTGIEYGNSVQQTYDNGFILTGNTLSFGAGAFDTYLIKTDSLGDTLWTQAYGKANHESGSSVDQCSDSGFVVTGYASSFDIGGFDVYLIKTDAYGNSGGCNQRGTATVITSPAIISDRTSSDLGNGGAGNNTATVVMNTATTDSLLCFALCNLNSDISVVDISCNGASDGSINLTVLSGSAPYTFMWSNGDTLEDISGLNAGYYSILISDTSGCFNAHSVIMNDPLLVSSSFSTNICSGDSILLEGSYQSTAGTYYDSSVAVNGCDSIIATTLIVKSAFSTNDTIHVICNGDSILVYGAYRTTAGIYYDSLISVDGCDSIHFTVIDANYQINDSPIGICGNDSALIYGVYRNTAGTYYDSLITVDGCDSIHSTDLTVSSIYSIIDPVIVICSGDSALIYGMYQTMVGTYYDTLTTVIGCDSIHSTILVNANISIIDPVVDICIGDSALIYGMYETTVGTYYDSLTTMTGCDSIHSTALTINPIYSTTSPDEIICDGDSVLIFGTYRKTIGTYYDSSLTINGCDSIIATTLIVNQTFNNNMADEIICEGDSILIFGIYRKTAGAYMDSLASVDGCDSIGTTTLVVNITYSVNDPTVAICNGDSTLIYGTFSTTAGTYSDSFATVNGCDSIHSTVLSINPDPSKPTITPSGNTLSSSSATSYQWFFNGDTIVGETSQLYAATQDGLYSVTITDNNGCSATSDTLSVTIIGIVETFAKGIVNIYPNPNTGKFVIKIDFVNEPRDMHLEITNTTGQIIYKDKISQGSGSYQKSIDLSNHAAGLYNFHLFTDVEIVVSKQIILKK